MTYYIHTLDSEPALITEGTGCKRVAFAGKKIDLKKSGYTSLKRLRSSLKQCPTKEQLIPTLGYMRIVVPT